MAKSNAPKKYKDNLKVLKNDNSIILKKRKSFKMLVKSLSILAEVIEGQRSDYETILELYDEKLKGSVVENAELQIKMARTLADSMTRIKFTKDQKEEVREAILNLCRMSSLVRELSEEEEAFFKKWLDYERELPKTDEENKKLSEIIALVANETMGIEIAPGEIDLKNMGLASIFELSEKKYEEQFYTERDKSIKELNLSDDKETFLRSFLLEYQNLELYNVNYTIIATLLKLFDEQNKDYDNNYAKKALDTALEAFLNDEISRIVDLEIEWMTETLEKNNLNEDYYLDYFIDLMENQLEECEYIMDSMIEARRFQPVNQIGDGDLEEMQDRISEMVPDVNKMASDFRSLINDLSKTKKKKDILQFCDNIKELISQLEEDDDDWDDEDDDDWDDEDEDDWDDEDEDDWDDEDD